MYFTKPVNKLTFQEVVHFLKQGVPENTLLDYKYMLPKDNEKFAKTIAAFANSMGGTVIIGVKDEHDKPKPPFTGIAFHGKIRGQIESIIQNYIEQYGFGWGKQTKMLIGFISYFNLHVLASLPALEYKQ